MRSWHPLCLAAGTGVLAWSCFGVVEAAYTLLLQALPATQLDAPFERRHQLRLWAVYAVVGALVGIAAGLVVGRGDRAEPCAAPSQAAVRWSVVCVSVVLAFEAFWRVGDAELAWVAGSFCLAGALAAGSLLGKSRRGGWLAALANPWATSAMGLGALALLLADSELPAGSRLAATLVHSLVIVALARACFAAGAGRLSAGRSLGLMAAGVGAGAVVVLSLAEPAETFEHELPERPIGDRSLPNVVLISLDTVRADHLSLYGYIRPTSPRLEGFAEGATVYEHAYSTAPWTLPSHASMFTGLYPRAHGAHFAPPQQPHGAPLSLEYDTLAELLLRAGYRTAAVSANVGVLGGSFHLDQGFQIFDVRPVRKSLRTPFPRDRLLELLDPRFGVRAFEVGTRTAERVNEVAIPLLDSLIGAGAPFFLFVNYMDAHTPYVPPPPFDEWLPGRFEPFDKGEYLSVKRKLLRGKRRLRAYERAQMHALYDGSLAYLDLHVSRLLDRIEQLGVGTETLVIVTADHGEAFGEHRMLGHPNSVHQPEMHVPMVIRYPGQTSGSRVAAPVSLVDLLPTIAAVSGLPRPADLPGADLRRRELLADRSIVGESYPFFGSVSPKERFDRIERSVVEGRWKLIDSTIREPRLFDLESDPLERRDLAVGRPHQLDRMQGALEQWLATTPEGRRSKKSLDVPTLEALEALGYIQ